MFFCYTLTLGGEVMNHILLCYFCRLCVILAKIFGSIAVAIAVVYGVDYARKVLLPFVWKKKDLGDSSSQNGSSDSEDTDISDF